MDRFVTMRDVIGDGVKPGRYPISRATLWRLIGQGRFPQPVKIGGTTAWRLSDLEAWEKSLPPFAARPNVAAITEASLAARRAGEPA